MSAVPPDPLSRIEILARILVLEDSRSLGSGSLQAFLGHEDPAVRRRAAMAAGRIGDRLVAPRLVQALTDPVTDVRRAAALGLGFLGAPESAAALTTALGDPDPLVRGRAAEALSRIGDAASGPAIAEAFRRALPANAPVPLRIRGDDPGREDDPWVELRLELTALARLEDAKALRAVLIGSDSKPTIDWWVAVWSAMRVADADLTPILTAGALAEDPAIRALAARGLGALKRTEHLPALRRLSEDREPVVVREALRALVPIGSVDGVAIAGAHLDAPNPVLRREALAALASLPPDSRRRARVIDNVGSADPWIRAAAWPALIRIDAEDVGIVLATIGPDPDWTVRAAVARALGDGAGERAAALLQPLLKDGDARVVAAAFGSLVKARGTDAASTLLAYVDHADGGLRAAAVEGLAAIAKKSGRRFTTSYARAFEASVADADIETRLAVVDAAAEAGDEESKALLRRIAGSDPARVVKQRAMNALGDGFAPPEVGGLRIADARRLVSIYGDGDALPWSPRALLTTRYGTIELALDLVEAPLTSLSFVRLAQSGYFNGLTFHRVIPGFVAQGGDPRGDGGGGPGSTLRCEYNGRPYGRGSLGMALSRKDTGGSQFFITMEPQPHLDGAYTHFGRVLSGMEIVDRLRPGDVIERVDVFDGRESR
jgi:cyclophilin family peptidyl-prolyl cis-trans isomerase/HEAT repeat protein